MVSFVGPAVMYKSCPLTRVRSRLDWFQLEKKYLLWKDVMQCVFASKQRN